MRRQGLRWPLNVKLTGQRGELASDPFMCPTNSKLNAHHGSIGGVFQPIASTERSQEQIACKMILIISKWEREAEKVLLICVQRRTQRSFQIEAVTLKQIKAQQYQGSFYRAIRRSH